MRSTAHIVPTGLVLLASACGASTTSTSGGAANPCGPGTPSIVAAMPDLPCDSEATRVQAGADVTVGSTGAMTAELSPIQMDFSKVDGMCVVNVHWHLGAEHKNTGTYDIAGSEWLAAHGQSSPDIEAGNFCPGYDASDPKYTTEYDFEYCSDVHVGFTYEIHWPNSNLGMCGTEWQYQTPFMDGVLCKANEANLPPEDAVASVFDTKTTKIGVQAQVFTVVNDPAYDYPDWDAMKGWNPALRDDVAIYQGSTTGQRNGNQICRGSGGMVTWQVDRGCHLISAKAMDHLCKAMKEQKDDMSEDTQPHDARKTTDAAITTDIPMNPSLVR